MRQFRIIVLYVLSFVASISPLTAYFIANRDRYVCSRYDGFKLFLGGIVVAVILLLKVIKKLKINSGVSLFSTICVLSYLLAPIIQDLMVLSFLALVGELLDLFIQVFISIERKKAQAALTARAVEKAISNQKIGRV